MTVSTPKGLGRRGGKLWRQLLEEFEFAPRELDLVLETCRSLDSIDALSVALESAGVVTTGSMGQTVLHPAVAELRQQRAAFGRLLAQLGLEDAEFAAVKSSRASGARAAAQQRWRDQTRAKRASSA